MINNRPTIIIYSVNVDDYLMLREICAGIEEEGVLYDLQLLYYGVLDEMSHNAANESMLGSGIGVIGTKLELTLRGLPKGQSVFYIEEPSLSECRKLGANAARAVKRVAFYDLND